MRVRRLATTHDGGADTLDEPAVDYLFEESN